jgi:hypothetical protein
LIKEGFPKEANAKKMKNNDGKVKAFKIYFFNVLEVSIQALH